MRSPPCYPGDFTEWTELARGKALVSEYAVLLSPDQSKSAIICVTDGRVVTIYDTATKRLEYSHPGFGRGLAVLSDLIGPVTSFLNEGDAFGTLRKTVVEKLIRKGIRCSHCGVPYVDYVDFMERNPRKGFNGDTFVDEFCWDAYKTQCRKPHKLEIETI